MAAAIIEPAEFGAVFERHVVTIHGYLSRRLGRDRADDLTAEVFRIAFHGRSQFDPDRGGVRPWLYGIANNVVRQHLRDRQRAERALARLEPAEPISDDISLVERVDAQSTTGNLDRALSLLRPADREALVLHVVEQLTYTEVADLMGTPVGTVRSRISRARLHLRAELTNVAELKGAHDG